MRWKKPEVAIKRLLPSHRVERQKCDLPEASGIYAGARSIEIPAVFYCHCPGEYALRCGS